MTGSLFQWCLDRVSGWFLVLPDSRVLFVTEFPLLHESSSRQFVAFVGNNTIQRESEPSTPVLLCIKKINAHKSKIFEFIDVTISQIQFENKSKAKPISFIMTAKQAFLSAVVALLSTTAAATANETTTAGLRGRANTAIATAKPFNEYERMLQQEQQQEEGQTEQSPKKNWWEFELGDPVLDEVALYYLGQTWHQAGDAAEVLETLGRHNNTDKSSWTKEWRKTAERLEKLGDKERSAGAFAACVSFIARTRRPIVQERLIQPFHTFF